ncbi:MAG: DNA primase [Patescibacteria group bacterium]|nr:DNA primase [Patescibacteria group bacterium]
METLSISSLVKEKIDIVDFLGQYLKLTPAGKNFRAVCPFHKEKTPSFMISPDKQIWHCFGCGNGGDVIKFLMLYENLEFFDALKVLAEKAGVNLDVHGGRDFKTYDVLYKVLESAKEFYRNNLYGSEEVKKYLIDRGLKGETAKEFELGVAPDEYDALTRHLLNKKFSIADMEKAGLIFKTERGTYWDRFRGRLMFPLYNHVGKVVGFTGRILPGRDDRNTGKYVNSPETPIFQKSKILYGFHKTKNDIREARSAILVEGQMDFLMMWQDGVKNVIATSGTALTSEHLKTLKKIADELILSFDADEAGQVAAERGIDLASGLDLSVKVLVLDDPKMKDPADVVRERPGHIAELLKTAKPAMEYYFYKYLYTRSGETDFQKVKKNLRVVLGKVKLLSSPIEKDHWIKELSEISKLGEGVLLEEMENIKEAQGSSVAEDDPLQEPEREFTRRDLICQRLMGLAMNDKEINEKFKEYLDYLPESYRKLYENSGKDIDGSLNKTWELISLRFSFENAGFSAKGEVPNNSKGKGSASGDLDNKLKDEFAQLIHELKLDHLKERQARLGAEARELEAAGKDDEWMEKVKEYKAVTEEIHKLKAQS